MLNYRKFRRGTKAEVDELLRIEKAEYPMRIVYCFGISHEHPGTFILTYIRSTNPHHEYIGLYPKGFKFRKRMFEDIDRLVAYFQRHIDDPQHDSAQSIRSVAAIVPMRSPAVGGSSGASGGSGWGGSTNEGGWRGQSFDRERSSTPGSRTGEVIQKLLYLVSNLFCLVHCMDLPSLPFHLELNYSFQHIFLFRHSIIGELHI